MNVFEAVHKVLAVRTVEVVKGHKKRKPLAEIASREKFGQSLNCIAAVKLD